jgi:VIT1/CCC1 family predicted Fe2+/Mn2+ transporter
VLGANDGIVSTVNLIVGVAAVAATQNVYTLNKDKERKRHAPRRRTPIADRLVHTVSHSIPHQYD